ncbi:hypothetical protein GGD62_008403 [Bradyrhizobium sp. ERR14]|nr:hypothetical protein [Bradyrhizobium sp. ERR14]
MNPEECCAIFRLGKRSGPGLERLCNKLREACGRNHRQCYHKA